MFIGKNDIRSELESSFASVSVPGYPSVRRTIATLSLAGAMLA
jgi:hypothetical protein